MRAPGRPAALHRVSAAPRQTGSARGGASPAAAATSRPRWPPARIPRPSELLQIYEERLELWRPRIGVADEWSQRIRKPVLRLLRIQLRRDSDKAPVDRNSDLPDLLSCHCQWTET